MSDQHCCDPTQGLDWRSYLQTIPNFVPSLSEISHHAALLVVDVQRSCTERSAGQGRWLAERYPEIAAYYYGRVEDLVIPNLVRLLASFRRRGGRVIFLTVGSNVEDGADLNPLRRRTEDELIGAATEAHILSGPSSPGRVIEGSLHPQLNEIILNKVGRSAFSSTGLDRLLRNMRLDRLVVAGVVTNGCVSATASEAAERGYECTVVEDGCAAFTQLLHDTALLQFAHGYGEVRGTSEILRVLEGQPEQSSTRASPANRD